MIYSWWNDVRVYNRVIYSIKRPEMNEAEMNAKESGRMR